MKSFTININDIQQQFLSKIYRDKNLLSKIKKPIGEVNIKNISSKIEVIEKLLKLKLEELTWKLMHTSYSK